jgi:hypothetical protein
MSAIHLFTLLTTLFLLFRARTDPSHHLGCHIGCEILFYSYGVYYPDFRIAGELPYGVNYGDVWVGVCHSSCFEYEGGEGDMAVSEKEVRCMLGWD